MNDDFSTMHRSSDPSSGCPSSAGYDLIVYGIVFADLVYSGIPHIPDPGEEVYAESFTFTGGAAYITAVAAARLGLRVGLIAPVGADPLSKVLEELLVREGVDVALLYRAEHPVYNVTVALNYGGDRGFLSYTEGIDNAGLAQHAVDVINKFPPRWMHLPAEEHTLKVALTARRFGIGISMDVGWNEGWLKNPALQDVVRFADVFTPNLKEALTITGAADPVAAAERLGECAPLIVVKTGPDGAIVKTREDPAETVPAPYVERVQDTTGAGDNFAAGLIYGLLNDMSPVAAVRIGNFCGSASTKALGGNGASPTRDQLEAWWHAEGYGALIR